jgi:chaperonin cofactor prefoldin
MTPEQLKQVADRFDSIDKQIQTFYKQQAQRNDSFDRSFVTLNKKIDEKCSGGSDSRLQKIIDFFKGL